MDKVTEKGFDDMYALNISGFRATCGLLNVLIVQQAAGRALTEQEQQDAARKGDDYFWSILDAENGVDFKFHDDNAQL